MVKSSDQGHGQSRAVARRCMARAATGLSKTGSVDKDVLIRCRKQRCARAELTDRETLSVLSVVPDAPYGSVGVFGHE